MEKPVYRLNWWFVLVLIVSLVMWYGIIKFAIWLF